MCCQGTAIYAKEEQNNVIVPSGLLTNIHTYKHTYIYTYIRQGLAKSESLMEVIIALSLNFQRM